MKWRHTRYEVLAGAMLLGEASESERDEFIAHAATCPLCDERMASDGSALRRLALLRDEETWRPALTEAVLTRIRERRAKRWRFAFGAVSYGGALAVVLNVVVVTGFADRLGEALHRPFAALAPASAVLTPAGGAALGSDAKLTPAFDANALLFASTRKSAPVLMRPIPKHRAARGARSQASQPPAVFSGLTFGGDDGTRSLVVEKAGNLRR